MKVDFGLFEGDELLQRNSVEISENKKNERFGKLNITHHLLEEMAEIVIEVFEDGEREIKSTMHMPIHESEDWESIELDKFTLAFRCILNA